MAAYVWWSFYVRIASVKNFKDEHLPPIRSALYCVEFEVDIHKEVESPGLLRGVTYQNLREESVTDVVALVLRRAYRLANGWVIHGLNDLNAGELRHIMGVWHMKTPTNRPPALESVLFEVLPGRITEHPRKGVWLVADGGSRIVPD